jgi:hypothetical protein
MEQLYKFGSFPAGRDEKYEYPSRWTIEETSGPNRLQVTVSEGHVDLLLKLIDHMADPFWILYLLIVARSEGDPGRYQSADPLSVNETKDMLSGFRDFFESDGRHNLWIASTTSADMLVYDRHDVIYCYGDLLKFQSILAALGIERGDLLLAPDPHSHHYHASLDAEQKRLLKSREWLRTPLKDHDEG